MKIAFWSPGPGHSGTTSNMLAIAVMSAMRLKKSTYLLQTHFTDRGLEKSILGNDAGVDMFENIGLDSLTRNIKISELNEEIIHNSSISLYNNRMHILPGTSIDNKHLPETDLPITLPIIINSINKFYDLVFLDLGTGTDEVSKIIREEADLVVVTFTQNKNTIQDYFTKYQLPEDKAVYLIGNYDADSRYNLANLGRSYHSLKNKIAVIPYNVGFMDAMIDGKVMNYMIKNIVNCKGENNLYFIKKVEKAVDLIFEKLMKGGDIV